MRRLRCPQCRGKVRPNDGSTIGAWYCQRCDCRYTDAQIQARSGNNQDAKVVDLVEWRRAKAGDKGA